MSKNALSVCPSVLQVFVLEGILGLLNAQRDLTGGLGGKVANIESDLGQFAGRIS